MPDYSKSIIYTIRTKDSLYVGSTTHFINRKSAHKKHIYKEPKNFKLYNTIRDNNGEWDMKPYKEFPCENKTQLRIEEERIRYELKADLNMCLCYGNDKEKYFKYQAGISKEKKAEYSKRWRDKNKEQKLEYQREYRKKKKDEKKD